MEAAIQPLIKDSSWWASAAFTLYEGEVAWEIAARDSQENPTTVYMLRGDGLPVNSNSNYKRLRVSADSLILNYLSQEGQVTQTIQDAFTAMVASQEALEGDLSAEEQARQQAITAEQTARANADSAEVLARQNADSAEALTRQNADGILQQNIDAVNGSWNQAVSDEAAARANADGAEATARANADSALDTAIGSEAAARANADSALGTAIGSEATARENADSALGTAIGNEATARANADSALDTAIDDEAAARANADAALQELADQLEADKASKQALADFEQEVAEDYAPLDSPHFTGVPTVPSPAAVNYSEPMQALPVEDFLELFNLTMGTSGQLRRIVDTDAVTSEGTPTCLPYERILDRNDGKRDEYREVDTEGRDYATTKQFWELYLFVLGTMQVNLRTLDTDGRPGDFGFDFRKLDVADGAKPEIRDIDEEGAGPFYDDYMNLEDCYWIDGVPQALLLKKGTALSDYLRLSLCSWEGIADAAKNSGKTIKIPAELSRLGTLEERMKQIEQLVKNLTGGNE